MVVRFDRDKGIFEDTEFIKFCEENNIVKIDKEFINLEGNIYYSFFIEYLSRKAKREKPDLKSLSALEQEQYQQLREWRNELAAKEGIPAYIIMYNAQLYDIIKKQPQSIEQISLIKGMKQKSEKYGTEIIKLLKKVEEQYEE